MVTISKTQVSKFLAKARTARALGVTKKAGLPNVVIVSGDSGRSNSKSRKGRAYYTKGKGKPTATRCRKLTRRLDKFVLRSVPGSAGDFRRYPKRGWGQLRSFLAVPGVPGNNQGFTYFTLTAKGVGVAMAAERRLTLAGKSVGFLYSSPEEKVKAENLFAVRKAMDVAKAAASSGVVAMAGVSPIPPPGSRDTNAPVSKRTRADSEPEL